MTLTIEATPFLELISVPLNSISMKISKKDQIIHFIISDIVIFLTEASKLTGKGIKGIKGY